MEKKDIHFIGFLANVDDSILKLDLGHPFKIEKISQGDTASFMGYIRRHYGVKSDDSVLSVEDQVSGIVHNQSFFYYCVTANNVELFEGTPRGVVIRPKALSRIFYPLRNKIRLLRLFKEGNVLMRFSLFYHLEETEPKIIYSILEGPLVDSTLFKLNKNEIGQLQEFINTAKMPFEKDLQLAFESFELSYENHSSAMSFLSLMIAMEVMFNRSKQDELRYAISRNAAVLLGKDKDDSDLIFKEVRKLYDKRSKIVHEGYVNEISPKDVIGIRHYVREAIKEIHKIGKNKVELLGILNACGFGQRTWRDGH